MSLAVLALLLLFLVIIVCDASKVEHLDALYLFILTMSCSCIPGYDEGFWLLQYNTVHGIYAFRYNTVEN